MSKKLLRLSCLLVCAPAFGQSIQVQPVEVLYGDQIYRGEHQVVLSTPEDVTIIPAEKARDNAFRNMVVSANPSKLSYLEESKIAKREQEIYTEVNRRTEEAPFTVLFTGHIPEEIQQKRLSMMPEVGIFGDQLDKLKQDQSQLHPESESSNSPDEGQFSEVVPGNRVLGTPTPSQAAPTNTNQAEMSNEQKLEQLIGG